jgi:hypothetical protein
MDPVRPAVFGEPTPEVLRSRRETRLVRAAVALAVLAFIGLAVGCLSLIPGGGHARPPTVVPSPSLSHIGTPAPGCPSDATCSPSEVVVIVTVTVPGGSGDSGSGVAAVLLPLGSFVTGFVSALAAVISALAAYRTARPVAPSAAPRDRDGRPRRGTGNTPAGRPRPRRGKR